MLENRHTIIAIILSGLVLIAWQYFYNIPQMERQRAQQRQAELAKATQPNSTQAAPAASPSTVPQTGNAPSAAAPSSAANAPAVGREEAISATPRVKIETPSVVGSISL